ncbi:MAG: cation diffusion facilitator family transporter, partial [Elusimicrobia bacterium]|nr:cation diffusion facilitator family transporter [Elusimicrobiota bacterium]
PPQAAPGMDSPSASVLFDGISARPAASAGDPVFPGDDPLLPRSGARKPLPRVHPLLPGAHAPLHVDSGAAHDGHAHGHDHSHPEGGAHESALKRAMAAASFFIAIEMLGGWLTGNAALIADSFHLAADQVIIAAALFSAWLSRRPASSSLSGLRKAEPVVGLLAAALIGFTGVHMGVEAVERFLDPGAAATWSVALFALASLGANLSSALILRRHHGKSLGVKGAFMVAITDTVGSIGVIVSAAAAILFGWTWMEPLVVALIGLMIVRIAWGLAKPAWTALRAPAPPR